MHPINVYLNQKLTDRERRSRLYAGDIFILSNVGACKAICDFAMASLREGFGTQTPETAFRDLPVEEFVRKAASIKTRFTNGLRAKELLRDFALETGTDPEENYFDLPRLRIVPPYDYLHCGVSYNYAAHRDTWYGGPNYQINYWMPAMPISPEQTMSVLPAYFKRPVKNSSRSYNLEYWNNIERPRAVDNIQEETRVHPMPEEPLDVSSEIRFGFNAGDILIFSGCHLHASVPNQSAVTRFSVDFRFYHVEDIRSDGNGPLKAPANIDCEATSDDYGLRDLFHLGNFSPFNSSSFKMKEPA